MAQFVHFGNICSVCVWYTGKVGGGVHKNVCPQLEAKIFLYEKMYKII